MINKENLKREFEIKFREEKKEYKLNLILNLIYLFGLLILIVGATIGLCFSFNPILVILVGIGAFVLFCALPIVNKITKFEIQFKKQLLPKLIDFILNEEEYKYERNGIISEDIFNECELFSNDYNLYTGEDFFSLLISRNKKEQTTLFAGSDLNVKNITEDEDGNKKTKTIFKGMFCRIKFSSYFNCKLEINTNRYQGLFKINLESIEFRNKFKTYSDDQINARLILTTNFMEKLIKLSDSAKCNIRLSFINDNLFLIFDKNFFKVLVKGNAFDFRDIEAVYDDINLIKDLCVEIQQNKKIFKM